MSTTKMYYTTFEDPTSIRVKHLEKDVSKLKNDVKEMKELIKILYNENTQLRKLTRFDYENITLHELKKCI